MQPDNGQDSGPAPSWEGQLIRHLDDLRTGTYEGANTRADRETVFRTAVDLVSGTVLASLQTVNTRLLAGHGSVTFTGTDADGDGGIVAAWDLGWPAQQASPGRLQPGPVPGVQVRAIFPRGWTHGHLRGRRLGNWPLQVTSPADVPALTPVIGAIIAAELHEVIYESAGTWQVIDGYLAQAGRLGSRRLAAAEQPGS